MPDEDGNILITRKLSLSGKGLIKINGKPYTASALKEISTDLINIHGQHDNQALLNPEKHCGFVDAVAENEQLRSDYYDEFKNLNKIRKELNSLVTDEDEKQRKTELLKYQINEIETAQIKLGEIDELKARLQIAEDFEKNLKDLKKGKLKSKLKYLYYNLLSDNEILDYLNMRYIVNKELIRLNPQRKSIAMSLCKHDTIDYSFINKKKLIKKKI